MEAANEAFTVMLIIANVLFSWKGFGDRRFFERHMFDVGEITGRGDIIRIFSSGFLHANVAHLLFNMMALYSFSVGVGTVFGFRSYLAVYFGSLVGGNMLALYIQRNNPEYRAVGASGAVCGVIYSSILIFPDSAISILFLPIAIPSWLFGILFIFVSVYGIRTGIGNIGHEAHLGGAISGILISIMLQPWLLRERPILALALLLPIGTFMYLLATRPGLLGIGGARRSGGRRDGRR